MEVNKRIQDVSQVFDRNWNLNNNNTTRKEFLDSRKEHFKRMYNIRDKEERRQEILRANSVNGQVESLNNRMQAMNQRQNRVRMNDFKNNFR